MDLSLLAEIVGPALVGASLGTLVGVLPGIGPAATMALLLPLSFALSPGSAIVLLCGVYFGSQYGSSTTAILLNIPGEASGVVTAEEGHRMARNGRAGPALAIAAIASLVAGLLTALFVWLATPLLARVALALSSADIAALVFLSGIAIATLGTAVGLRGAAMLLVGMSLGFIGTDFGGGPPRFTFGIADLRDGIGLVPLTVGLFGIGDVLASHAGGAAGGRMAPVGRVWASWKDLRQGAAPAMRGTLVGALVGLLPGGSTLMAAIASQVLERRLASDRDEYGRGAISGVAGPEAANNAAAQAGLVPLIGLGVPANPAMAVMLGAFMLHGVPPGAALFSRAPEVFDAIIWGMIVANFALLVLNLPLVGVWVRLLKVPLGVLTPIIIVVSVLGVYAQSRSVVDVWLLLAFGAAGFGLRKAGYPLTPIVFGAVLGPLFEDHIRRAFLQARGDLISLLTEPLVGLCLLGSAALVMWRAWPHERKGVDGTLI